MTGIAYAQLVNPGCPVIFGAFVTSIDMNSGAPTFGTPEASKILWGAGQLARRLNLPFRSGGALCGSKLPDAQAAYESANTLQAALIGGVNFMLHACGWLEGGLVSGYEKFVLDADQLGVLHSLAEGIDLSENGQAMDAMREVGPGGHYLGCAHTQANFKDAFWRTQVLDYRPFETWAEAGGPDSMTLANARARRMLAEYEAPAPGCERRTRRARRCSELSWTRRARPRSRDAFGLQLGPLRGSRLAAGLLDDRHRGRLADPLRPGRGARPATAAGSAARRPGDAGAGADLDAEAAEVLRRRDGVLVGGVVAEHHRPAAGEGRAAGHPAQRARPCGRCRA